MDFNFVTNRLATGASINDPAALQVLIKAGITHIINCQAEHDDAPFLVGTDLKYLRCPTNDDGQPKGTDWFQPGIEFALAALAVPKNKCYFHCAAGVSRGPSMTFAVLRAQGLTHDQAKKLIITARPQASITYRAYADAVIKVLGYE